MANTPVALYNLTYVDVLNNAGGNSSAGFLDTFVITSNVVVAKRSLVDTRPWLVQNLGAALAGNITIAGHNAASGIDANLNLNPGFFSFKFQVTGIGSVGDVTIARVLASTATLKMELRLDSNGHLVLYDSTTTLIATGTTVLQPNTEYVIDLKCGNTGTSSAVEVRINGVSEINTTGAVGATNCTRLTVGCIVGNNSGGWTAFNAKFYEVWIDSAGYAPARYMLANMGIIANGPTQMWTGGTNASDFNEVDEPGSSWSSSDYVQDPNAALGLDGINPPSATNPVLGLFQLDAFVNGNWNSGAIQAGSTIFAVKPVIMATDGPSSVPNSLKVGMYSAGSRTEVSGSRNTVLSLPGDNLAIIVPNDPATGIAWTRAGLEAACISIAEGTVSVQTRAYAARATIAYVPPRASYPADGGQWHRRRSGLLVR